MKEILIATKNEGKMKEFKGLFAKLGFEVKSLTQMTDAIDVVEDGATFAENAIKKAEQISAHYNVITVADDSGLIVDALDGRPGIYSARYAGEGKNDQENLQKVLSEMEGVPVEKRTARFHCTLALAIPLETTITVEGECEGIITEEPTGEFGFGYDPIMFIPSVNRTMAQLTKEEKNTISHRAKALLKLQQVIEQRLLED